MATQASSLTIKWSVWDSSPEVSWSWSGGTSMVVMKMPPISVSHLEKHGLVAIVGSYEELGSKNLLFYSYDGALIKSYSAPDVGEDAQFGAIRESGDGLEVAVGGRNNGRWVEVVGKFDPDNGAVSGLHRGY